MSCTPLTVTVGGVTISTSDFQNAAEILAIVSGDGGDPTQDEFEENIANGNNDNSATGVQFPPAKQTTLPPPIPTPAEESNDKPPPIVPGAPVTCSTWTGDYNFQLSPNFKVKDFTISAVFPNQLTDYPGYTKSERCCNLQHLAVNVAEALRAKFGPFNINSGVRNASSSVSPSQHIKGQAMDVQFSGWSYARYWENAAWIKDNIPYDQFIFEHSDKTGLAWYHLSYNKSGNRPATANTKVMTMYRNNYSSGLKRYG